MNIKILLTSYLLTYMYGDRVYEDPLLLGREVIKKAYNEGLYYISSEKNIENILKNPDRKRSFLVFAGIPTFQEVCVDLSPSKKITALKINLPYETLASFNYIEEGESALENKNIPLKEEEIEKVSLHLSFQNNHLEYTEEETENLEENKEEILKFFQKEIESFRFAILNNIEYLREKLITFLESSDCKEALEKEETLKLIKECYEEFVFLKDESML